MIGVVTRFEYSERYGWHLKPTEQRRQERLQEHVAKRKGRIDHRTNRPKNKITS